MPKLPLDQLTTGMVVDRDVKDRSGRLLLRAGMPLHERALKILQTWGVTEVQVRGDESLAESVEPTWQQTMASMDPGVLDKARAEVAELFRHVNRDFPPAAVLAELVTLRVARRLSGHGQ